LGLIEAGNIKTDKYWKIIKKNFFKNVLYKKRYFSQMEINYITFLAKTIYSKLVTIALENNELIERLIEIYLKMCKKDRALFQRPLFLYLKPSSG
jgi:hypothetical protein